MDDGDVESDTDEEEKDDDEEVSKYCVTCAWTLFDS